MKDTEFNVEELRAEMERDFQKFNRTGKDKRLHVKKKDFPCSIDGIFFNSIDEYVELFGNSKKDQSDCTTKRPPLHSPKGGQLALPTSSYTAPVLPAIKLKMNHFQTCDTIQHMNYCVFRVEAGYFAVWVSLNPNDKLPDVLWSLSKLTLPSGVVTIRQSRVHTSKAYNSYRSAEDNFYKGGETFSRMRQRISKAENPDYIPPNLRKMAVAATFDKAVWDVIPKNEHDRLIKWLEGGCKGWYGKDPRKGWYTERGIKSPNSYYSAKDKVPNHVLEFDEYWDSKTNEWKPLKGKEKYDRPN